MRHRWARAAAVVFGLGLAASPLAAHADGAPGSGLGGYRITSAASALDVQYNDGSEVDLTIPEAQTDFSTGIGHALASDAYPGPIGGNPGPALQQFLGANLPPQVVDALGQVQDPYQANASSSGPHDAAYPPGGPAQAMSAVVHADDAKAIATGTVASAGDSGGLVARSVTTIGASSVTTTATSTASDLSIAGVLHVGKVVSTATASSDGSKPKATGSTTIAGLTVAGQSISLNPKGLAVGALQVPVDVAAIVNPVLKSAGITLSVSPLHTTVSGGQAVVHAPALTIFVNPPNNGGNTFTVTLGGAEAEANASAPYAGSTIPTPTAAPAAAPTGSGGPDLGSPAATSPGFPGGDSTPTGTPASAPATPTPGPGVIRPLATALADFRGLPVGLLVVGLLVAGMGAFGLGKIPDDVLAEKAETTCPLERNDPS